MQNYDLLNLIGQGTFGSVYKARARFDPRQDFAIKRYKRRAASWAAAMQLNEIKVTRAPRGRLSFR